MIDKDTMNALYRLAQDTVQKKELTYLADLPLYRYRSILDWACDEIRTGNIYLSETDKENDPFDSSHALSNEVFCREEYPISTFISAVSYISQHPYIHLPSDWIEQLDISGEIEVSVRSFEEMLMRQFHVPTGLSHFYLKLILCAGRRRRNWDCRVASFSETKSSIPMWAYYADNHQGICLEYDTSRLSVEKEDEYNLKQLFHKMYYSDIRPKDISNHASALVKSTQWSHELEWRIIQYTQQSSIHVPCLTAVYLGVNFDFKNLDEVIAAIEQSGRSIALYSSHPDAEKYELVFTRIRY